MPTQPMNVGIRHDQQAEQRRRRNIGTVQRLVMNSSTRRDLPKPFHYCRPGHSPTVYCKTELRKEFERRTNSASQRTEAMCKPEVVGISDVDRRWLYGVLTTALLSMPQGAQYGP
jgi:hypothetical protein